MRRISGCRGQRGLAAAGSGKFAGSDVERGVLLNQLYSSITRRLEIFASLPFETLDRMALKARLDELGVAETVEA